MEHAIPCFAFNTLGKRMGVKHTVLLDFQPPIAAFTCLHSCAVQRLRIRRWAPPPYPPKIVREGTLTLTQNRQANTVSVMTSQAYDECSAKRCSRNFMLLTIKGDPGQWAATNNDKMRRSFLEERNTKDYHMSI